MVKYKSGTEFYNRISLSDSIFVTSMTRDTKNSLRGMILLLVFTLNTVAGFACSIGLDMGYNLGHHKEQKARHPEKGPDNSHHHESSHSDDHEQSGQNPESKDCCVGDVTQFIKMDKSVESNQLLHAPEITVAFLPEFILPVLGDQSMSGSSLMKLRRSWPPSDHMAIRIVIQSFQI